MQECTFAEIESRFDLTIAAVAVEQRCDPVCSTSHWILPAAAAFAARSRPRVFRSDAGVLALLEHHTAQGRILSSFDTVWGFATPLVGADPVALIDDVQRVLATLDFDLLSISGLHPHGPMYAEVLRLNVVGYTTPTDRLVADLDNGFETWIARRSPRFRRSLRAAAHRAEAAGLVVESIAPTTNEDVDRAFTRIYGVERTSWKTDVNSGLIDTDLGVFTQAMSLRFATIGMLRVQFAVLDGVDVGYVIGARVGDRYRGFQHSFNQHHPDLSIGKVLQLHTIGAMADEGVRAYDMGMAMGYKQSYTDRIESTVSAIIAGAS